MPLARTVKRNRAKEIKPDSKQNQRRKFSYCSDKSKTPKPLPEPSADLPPAETTNCDTAGEHELEEAVGEMLNFNFDDFTPGSKYNVVINTEGDSIPIQAPEIQYYHPPYNNFMTHHIYF